MSARILVIEDNPANLELMTYLLRAFKYEPLSATDGESGLALAQSARPDLVVCDIQLPKMDGFEVVRRLKAEPATRAMPVIAVTAFAMVGDRDRALSAGFDGYIGKPITPETFVSQVEHFIRDKSSGRAAAGPAGVDSGAPVQRALHAGARILVVDNTEANRELMASTLRPVGYEVVLASNVNSALATARTLPPDLIISDVHMPGRDGFEFLACVQGDPDLRDIPFALVSAGAWDEKERAEVRRRGAELLFLRTRDPYALLQRVEELLTRKEKARGEDPGG